MKQTKLVALIGLFLFANISFADAKNDQIKIDCEEIANKVCGEKCIKPDEPSTDDYPEWWSQAQKNKEWNVRIELKKQAKVYQETVHSKEPYVNYCIAKETDLRIMSAVSEMVRRPVIEHENIFYNWNQLRLGQLKSNAITFSELEKDREIYNKRYEYYKKHKGKEIRASIEKFTNDAKGERLLHRFDGKHKNVELQDEFLSYLANDFLNYNAYFEVKTKLEKRESFVKTLFIQNDESKKIEINITEKEMESLDMYLTKIKRLDKLAILKYKEKNNLKIEKNKEN